MSKKEYATIKGENGEKYTGEVKNKFPDGLVVIKLENKLITGIPIKIEER